MQTIQRTIEELQNVVAHSNAASSVSQWSVGMHVHHCCMSMIGIAKSLRKSTPPVPTARPSVQRTAVLVFGFIPRGRAQSPSFIVPKPKITQPELITLLQQSSTLVAEATTLDRATWFTHPLLGPMHRDQALKFVLVHNRHHLKIVADILKQRR